MRKTLNFTVVAEGRDKGKMFQLREMAAARAEKWAMRALLALARSGVEMDEDFAQQGMRGVAILGIKALSKMHWEDAEPLVDEMMECVRCIPDPGNPLMVRDLIDDDIDEIETRLTLRMEVAKLHVDFSTLGGPSRSI